MEPNGRAVSYGFGGNRGKFLYFQALLHLSLLFTPVESHYAAL